MTKIFHSLIASATDREMRIRQSQVENLGHDDEPLNAYEVSAIHVELGIPQTPRKPFQKRLFEMVGLGKL